MLNLENITIPNIIWSGYIRYDWNIYPCFVTKDGDVYWAPTRRKNDEDILGDLDDDDFLLSSIKYSELIILALRETVKLLISEGK